MCGRGRPSGLIASAVWLGLALQTHPTMVALLPGAGHLALSLKRRDWLQTRWPYLAGLIGVLMVANIIVFNLITNLGSLRRAEAVQTAYARGRGTGLELYTGNLPADGPAVGPGRQRRHRHPRAAAGLLGDPLVAGAVLLALAGAACCWPATG